MASTFSAFFKEYHQLYKTVHILTEGQVVIDDLDYDENDEKQTFYMFITPNDGLYKNATCKFLVEVKSSYPTRAPDVKCLTRVFHPNIDNFDTEDDFAPICVNLLGSDWQPGVGLDGCIMAVLFLFHNPNTEDPLNTLVDSEINEEEFAEIVWMTLRGIEFLDFQFDRLIDEDVKKDEETVLEAAFILADKESADDVDAGTTQASDISEVNGPEDGVVETRCTSAVVGAEDGVVETTCTSEVERTEEGAGIDVNDVAEKPIENREAIAKDTLLQDEQNTEIVNVSNKGSDVVSSVTYTEFGQSCIYRTFLQMFKFIKTKVLQLLQRTYNDFETDVS